MAWGGTNMRAASSDLFDVAGKPIEKNRTSACDPRLWKSRNVPVRHSALGPVVSDSPLFRAPEGAQSPCAGWATSRATRSPRSCGRNARRPRNSATAFATMASAGKTCSRRHHGQYRPGHGGVAAARECAVPPDLVLDADDPRCSGKATGTRCSFRGRLIRRKGSLHRQTIRPRGWNAYHPFPIASERVRRLKACCERRTRSRSRISGVAAGCRVHGGAGAEGGAGAMRSMRPASPRMRPASLRGCAAGMAGTRRMRRGRSCSRPCCITSRAGWSSQTPRLAVARGLELPCRISAPGSGRARRCRRERAAAPGVGGCGEDARAIRDVGRYAPAAHPLRRWVSAGARQVVGLSPSIPPPARARR